MIGDITTIAKLGTIKAGFILVPLLAIGNVAGKIIAGMLSDRIGRLWTMCIIFLSQAGLMLMLRAGLTDMATFVIVSVFPSAVKDNFGLKNFGIQLRPPAHRLGRWRFHFSPLCREDVRGCEEQYRDKQL